MQFNVEWLKRWVAVKFDAQEIADRLTSAGLEVDDVHPVAGEFTDIVVAEIEACEKHPDADKLSLCTVSDGGEERLQIVCGAPNARPGIRVPLARVGARIGADFEIKKAKLRGVESFGMLCSAKELGLSDDHSGLMELPGDAALGTPLREYLSLDDHAIEVDLTPNRADCLSIRGLALDVAASCKADYTPVPVTPVEAQNDERFPISLDSPQDCPRYVGRVIKGIDVSAETPLWMAETLRRCGLRSISPTVDVTNFVMLERGQPMHAFDLDKLNSEIIVRRAHKGEKLVLLDETEAELDEDVLAICDGSGPVAIAGIMGGLDTGVTEATTDILFESAYFNPAVIMGKSRRYGLHTDSSHRFERGVDPQGQIDAVERATELLLQIAGGEPGPLLVTEEPQHLPVNPEVSLRPDRLRKVIGCDISDEQIEDILQRLGMQVDCQGDHWMVTAPSIRVDIAIEEDLIEEVARIYGYDRIPEAAVGGTLPASTGGSHQVPLNRLRDTLCTLGYQEAINYSFVDEGLLKAVHQHEQGLPLANPLSSDLGMMRTSLIPGLLSAASRNLRRQQSRVKLFETGVVFLREKNKLNEIERVGAISSGLASPEQWGQENRPSDFFDAKGVVEQLLALRGYSEAPEFKRSDKAWLHPGASAEIALRGRFIGWVGSIHPTVLKAFDIKGSVLAFEIDTEELLFREVPITKDISRFPSVRRDLAVLVPEDVSYAQIRECIAESTGELLEKVIAFDVYQGSNLKKGYKSLAIGLIFNNVSSTLKDEDVDPLIETAVSAMEQRLGAQLRG